MELYDKIRVTTDNYQVENVPRGTKRVILELYENGDVEVQFETKDNNGMDNFFPSKKMNLK